MTELLYYEDRGLFEFEANILDIEGRELLLDKTAFYPGGGGQIADKGTIDGVEVSSLRKDERGIWHSVEGSFAVGQTVKGQVDADWRRKTTCGHTAEHMLAGNLVRLDPSLSVGKVNINPPENMVIINGHMEMETVKKALQKVNLLISQALDISSKEYSKKEAMSWGDVRAKWNVLPEGPVRIVSICDFDRSACTGVHAMNTKDLKAVAITQVHKRGDSTSIHFLVGEPAIDFLAESNVITVDTAVKLDTSVDKIGEILPVRLGREALLDPIIHDLNESKFEALEPVNVGELDLYAEVFQGVSQKWLSKKAMGLTKKETGKMVVFATVNPGGGVNVIAAASQGLDINVGQIMGELFRELGGKGGGGPTSAGGGSDEWDIDKARALLEQVKEKLAAGQV